MRIRSLKGSAMLASLAVAGIAGGLLLAQSPPSDGGDQAGPAGAPAPSRVVTGNRTIEAGEVIDEVVVVGGDLRVRGQVTGNAIVVGGDLILESTGEVRGDAVVTGGSIRNEGGRVLGEMRAIEGQGLDVAAEVQRAVGGGAATAAATREVERQQRRESRDRFRPSPITRGIAGIVSTLALGLVLTGVGATLIFYGRTYLETVSDTARASLVRSGATGLAASFLVIPAFVVLIVALAVSIIGIPFLLVAIPAYPLAVFAAAVFGLLGVAHALGERTAEQSRDSMDLRYRNSYAYLMTGVGMLLLPHIAAHLISMTGFLGFIGTLLRIVTWLAIWIAATIGFGAVILSRGGTRRTFVPRHADPGPYDSDDLFGDDPIGGQAHA
jgi:hypothetical protein